MADDSFVTHLKPPEAARRACCSVQHLANLRVKGGGPPYDKRGSGRAARVLYPIGPLDAWITARRHTSTADTGAPQLDEDIYG